MKKVLTLILFATLLFGCSDDDGGNNGGSTQNYTSFTVTYLADGPLKNCVAGYFDKNGLCKKITDLGNLEKNQTSPEIRVDNPEISYIYIYGIIVGGQQFKIEPGFAIEKNKKNEFSIGRGSNYIAVDKDDSTEYPH